MRIDPTPPLPSPLPRAGGEGVRAGRVAPLGDLWRDLQIGARLLLRSPLFAAAAVLSLALGIGANTAIATLIDAVLLRDLPVPEPGQLHTAEVVRPDGESPRFSYPLVAGVREQLAGRAELCAVTRPSRFQLKVPGDDGPPAGEAGRGQLVSGECFAVLRQQPQLGRLLGPADDKNVDGHPVAVISDAYWSRAFARSADVLGSELVVNGASFTIVGVAQPGFMGPIMDLTGPDVWIPTAMQHAARYASNASSSGGDTARPWRPQPEISWLHLFARVPSEADLPAVAGALETAVESEITSRPGFANDEEDQRILRGLSVRLEPAGRGVAGLRERAALPLLLLLGMVGLLLAIACANVANLLLARVAGRRREIAIRLAIGAGRGRLVRQLLAESLLLSFLGGALGLLFAGWAGKGLLVLLSGATRPPDLDLGVGLRVLAFTLAVSLVTGIAFGLLPALRGSALGPAAALSAGARSVGTGRRAGRAGSLLVAGQMALSLVLLALASLLGRTVGELAQVDVGFQGRESVLVAWLDPPAGGYRPDELPALYETVLTRVRALPGVTSASLSVALPFGGSQRSSSLAVEGYEPAPGETLIVQEDIATDEYFRTLGLEVVRGRAFGPEDTAGGRQVTIVNETMARRFFAGRDPLGRRWSYGGPFDEEGYEIVGVVRDARYNDLREEVPIMAYRPAAQMPEEVLRGLAVRTSGDPTPLRRELQRALGEAAPRLPVLDVVTIEENVARALREERMISVLTAAFSTLALLLAALGLYGTIAYAVARRTPELGVRMALGARRQDVVWLVMRAALGVVLLGIAIGLPLALAAARGMGRLLYGIGPLDLVSHGAAALVLIAIAALAAWLPARRAARLDPTRALRAE